MRWLALVAALGVLAWLAWSFVEPSARSPSRAPRAPEAPSVTAETAPAIDAASRESAASAVVAPPITAATATTATTELRVLVVDDRDHAMPGCRVRVAPKGQPAVEATTDGEGRAQFALPDGRHRLDVTPADERFAPIDGRVTVEPGVPELRVVLERRSRLPFCVQLTIGEPPRPLAGARTTLHRHGGATEELTSDARGFVVMLAGDGRDTLAIEPTAANGPCFVVPTAGHETRESALPVLVPAAATLVVHVVDAADRPLAERTVSLTADSRSVTWPAGAFTRSGLAAAEARTSAAGDAEFAMLPAGVVVTARLVDETLPAPPSGELPLAAGANTTTLRIDECTIRGVVLDDAGTGLANVLVGVEYASAAEPPVAMHPVRAAGHTTRTDPEGRFEFARFGPGRWVVGVVPAPDRDVPLEPVCRVVDSVAGTAAFVELRTRPAGCIDATTVLPDGTPAPGVFVDVQSTGERVRWVTGARSDAEGRVRLGPLPAGQWSLATDVFDGRLGVLSPVLARTGDTNVRLVLHPTMVDVRIDVVDESGRPRRAFVWMRHRTVGDAVGFGSGIDGRADQEGLRAGPWDVLADDDGGRVAWLDGVELVPGERPTRLRLELRRGGTVVVPTLADDGLEIWCVRGTRVGFNDFVQPRDVRRITLPEGPWTIQLRRGEDVVRTREVRLTAGRESVVDW